MLLLFLAYAILFLPTALGALAASLRQVTPHLEEAARSLGYRPVQVFLKVTLPIVLPGVIAGAALVFLLTMEELPATLLLRPPGVETLATSIWANASEALFIQASATSLLLAAVSSLSVGLMFWREGRELQ
jgi:iron(III) transport system permease protein